MTGAIEVRAARHASSSLLNAKTDPFFAWASR
jgi:hypothetical protein